MRLFDHPARDRYAKLPEGYAPFVYRSVMRDSHPPKYLSADEQLAALIAEVERNGFGDDLVTADGNSLLTVVDRKLTSRRCKEIQARLAAKVAVAAVDNIAQEVLRRSAHPSR